LFPLPQPPTPPLFPYTTLFRSTRAARLGRSPHRLTAGDRQRRRHEERGHGRRTRNRRAALAGGTARRPRRLARGRAVRPARLRRSEEHTSELQSLAYLVCRLLL